MKVKNVTSNEMHEALSELNKKYDDNIIFNRFDVEYNWIHFTLKCRDSKKAGHRILLKFRIKL